MNEDSTKQPALAGKPLHSVWKWLIVFLAALLGSGLHYIVFEHVSPDFRTNLRMLLGGALFPFAVGMFFAIFFKGWKGVVIGVFFVLVVEGFSWTVRMNMNERARTMEQQPASPTPAGR